MFLLGLFNQGATPPPPEPPPPPPPAPTGTGGILTPKDFGAKYDGVTDDWAAHRAALDYCRINKLNLLMLNSGTSVISKELEIDSRIKIVSGPQTRLRFPPNTNGVRVVRPATSTSGGTGEGCVLSDLNLECTALTGTSGHGIVLDAYAELHNPNVRNFAGDGIHIEGAMPATNANCFLIVGGRCYSNGRDGLYLNGPDANAGVTLGLTCSDNGRNSIYDSSFLGNGHFHPHCSYPGKRSYVKGTDGKGYECILDHYSSAATLPVTGSNWQQYWQVLHTTAILGTNLAAINRMVYADGGRDIKSDSPSAHNTIFVNAYTEGGAPKQSQIKPPARVLGGLWGAGLEGGPNRPIQVDVPAYPQILTPAVKVMLGSNTRPAALEWGIAEAGKPVWQLVYDRGDKAWRMIAGIAGAVPSYQLCEPDNRWGLPTGVLNFPVSGYAFDGKRMFLATGSPASPPTTGVKAGDKCLHPKPVPGGVTEWTYHTDNKWYVSGRMDAAPI